MSSQEYPEAAYMLSIIGAFFVLIGGIVLTLAFIGILGIICAIIMFIAAEKLKSDPSSHNTSGAIIIIMAVFSWIGSIGGLVIGFLLGFIGGILAITWTRTGTFVYSPVSAGDQVCPYCTSKIPAGSTFCQVCGAQIRKP